MSKIEYYLNEDVISPSNTKTVYGRQGERVAEVVRNEPVAIVEGKSGRFPVHASKLINIHNNETKN